MKHPDIMKPTLDADGLNLEAFFVGNDDEETLDNADWINPEAGLVGNSDEETHDADGLHLEALLVGNDREETPDADRLNPGVNLVEDGHEEKSGPPMGVLDIGESEKAYLCLISLPGLKNNESDLSFSIKQDGTVDIHGVVPVPEYSSSEYKRIKDELNPPGPFTISFSFPGPVDPRLVSFEFRPDGILELVAFKPKPNLPVA